SSMDEALRFALDASTARYPNPQWIRCSFRLPSDAGTWTSLEGRSAGGAFAVGMLASLENRDLDPHMAISATLECPPGARPAGAKLGSVRGSLAEKLRAAARRGLRRVVVSAED